MELDEFFLLLRKAEMHETVDSEMDLTVGGVATSPSGGRKEKGKKKISNVAKSGKAALSFRGEKKENILQ